MPLFHFHASQEQFAPRDLLRHAQLAEHVGFDGVFSSDHLQPWSPSQGESAFTWSWLGAALQATERLRFSTISVPGGWRYHPVVLAQAIGTLAAMYPGRLPWVAMGSGEALNECAVGRGWPSKPQRNARLREGAEAVRALLAGQRVNRQGFVQVNDARVWTLPSQRVLIVGAATSVATARWLGSWADGLLTVAHDLGELKAIVHAFHEGGGVGKPVHVKLDLSWAPTEELAVQQAHDAWRFTGARGNALTELRQPEDFDRATIGQRPEDIRRRVFVSHDLTKHIARLRACAAIGVESIDLHNVGPNQAEFIEVFGSKVLPVLRGQPVDDGVETVPMKLNENAAATPQPQFG
jgi:probable non-F420 flavinoid oxidoreductase